MFWFFFWLLAALAPGLYGVYYATWGYKHRPAHRDPSREHDSAGLY